MPLLFLNLTVLAMSSVAIVMSALAMMEFLQEPSPAWVKEWGWPAAALFFLLTVCWLIVRAVWPLIKGYVANLQKQADDAHALVRELLEKAETRANEKSELFLQALDKQRVSHEEAMRHQGELQSKALEAQTSKITGAISETTATMKAVRESVDVLASKIRKGEG